MPIRILPPEIASQIAAGEVVERPASVVKELLENALDAGAKLVTITVEGAGKRLVEVADDGNGIPSDELLTAVERHATSKLTSAAELFQIRTLGFRGEALASIGSVSRMTLTSRVVEASLGARLRVEGGKIGPLQAIGAPKGTVVRVEDLFYNTPARLKFLKHDTTERRLIDSLAMRYALAYPTVRIHLKQEGRPALQTSGKGDRREVLAALYGAEVARQMLEVLSEDPDLTVRGFISPTSLTRTNRREIHFFINGRPVQDAALGAALLKAYHTFLMVGRYPMAILLLEMPPEVVDVNVHPTKAEVRFRHPERVFTGLQSAIRRALLAHSPLPSFQSPGQWYPQDSWRGNTQRTDLAWTFQDEQKEGLGRPPLAGDDGTYPTYGLPETALPPLPTTQPELPARREPLLRAVGQVALAYLVAEGPDGLYLIDQHAAHERILFERFMGQRDSGIASQKLLQPINVDLPPASARLLLEQLPILAKLGFEVESFGPHSFLVRSVPAILAVKDPGTALRSLVEDFEEDETPLQAETEARIIGRVCKRAAVKAGQSLTLEEQRALLQELENCRSPRTCPHGRPTMIHLSVDLLERQFGRRGAR